MQFFRSSLSRLAIAATLVGISLIAPKAAEARQPCGSFSFNWGGTISQRDMLTCAVEYNTGAGHNDRYYLEIKKDHILNNFQNFELSFPKDFDGSINDKKIRVLVNGKEVALKTTAWDSTERLENGATKSQEILNNLDAAANANLSPNLGGDLVLINGELVFLDAAALAEHQTKTQPQPETSATLDNTAPEAMAPKANEPHSRSLVITLAEPLKKESTVEIILDDVDNPSNGGIYVVTAFARSQGAPLPNRLGAWMLDIDR